MFKILLLTLLLPASVNVFSQASDFITVKKRNNRTVKTFFPGVPISFETADKRQVSGMIAAIRNDSVFVKVWDIRPMINGMGIPVTDTVGVYINGYRYTEIAKADVSDRMKFQQVTAGRLLVIGGTGYILLNIVNGAYQHQSITSKKNLTSLGIAAGAVGAGLLANYITRHRNKHHIEYIHMNDGKKSLRGF
ncbi:MAG: hypothetical protein ABI813_15825 [Bacteroidota bacterium]